MSKYKSFFAPEIEIDLPNYITELILLNYLKWNKIPIPNSPFWRSDIADQSDVLKELSKRYQAEISYVHDLLKVVSGEVLIKYLNTKKLGILRFLKKENQIKLHSDLFLEQIKFVKSLECINKKEVEASFNKIEYINSNQYTGKSKSKLGTL